MLFSGSTWRTFWYIWAFWSWRMISLFRVLITFRALMPLARLKKIQIQTISHSLESRRLVKRGNKTLCYIQQIKTSYSSIKVKTLFNLWYSITVPDYHK